MTKRKAIKLRYGCVKKLAEACLVSRNTVTKALKWNNDTDTENLIRRRAEEMGFIKMF